MSMFNECHIRLCDCTWLNVFSHAQSLLINHKKIFVCFSCFWIIFCFCKNVKNFKHQSHNEMVWFKKIKCYEEYGAKWKVSKLCNQVLWGVIYAYFYNWDRSHYLVLIVYDLIEFIIKVLHLTKDYLIVDIHTHHTCLCSMNVIFICVIVLD